MTEDDPFAYPRTLTLTDFLLARIAEDEAAVGGAWVHTTVLPLDNPMCPSRVLAECEAKRRTIRELEPFTPPHGWFMQAMRVVGYLALPYADHPDYREEWRP